MNIVFRSCFFWCGLIALNLLVFLPTFSLGPRGDTLAYLISTSSLRSLPELIMFFSSPEANEVLLSRQLLLLLLAFQIWLFQYDFFYWQVLSFVLHLLVVGQAARIFQKISTPALGFALASLFSVLTISAEMVAWPQISGCLIFIFCFLRALSALIDMHKGTDQSLRITFWLLLGCLFYEFSAVCCVIFFFAVRSKQKALKVPTSQSWLVLMPLAIIVPQFLSATSHHSIPHQLNLFKLAYGLGKLLAGFAYALLPAMLSFQPSTGRLYLNGLAVQQFDIALGMNVLAIILLLWAVCGLRRDQSPGPDKDRLLSPTIALFLVLHLCFVALRIALHAYHDYMNYSLYHYYFTLLLAFLWLPTTPFILKGPQTGSHGKILIIALGLLIAVNAFETHKTYRALSQRMSPWMGFFNATDRFVKAHRSENNFSFQIVYSDFSVSIPYQRSDGSPGLRPAFELLYKPYISDRPAYYLVYFQNTGLNVFTGLSQALEFANMRTQQIIQQ